MDIRQAMGMMQFMNQMKNTNPNQQINQLVNSGQVNNDMLQQAHQMAKPIYDAIKQIRR